MADTTNTSPGTSSTPGDGTPSAADLGSVYDAAQAQLALDAETDAKRARELAEGTKPLPADGRVDETDDDAPVYDERGNVRPRGTKGAKPMTFEQRAALARKQDRGGQIPEDGEPAVRKAVAAETKAAGPGKPQARRRRRS